MTDAEAARLGRALRAFTTRNVPDAALRGLSGPGARPRAGDLVLARVVELGFHERLHRVDGRRALLFREDEVLLAYGARYAPDQFEAVVPDSLGPCDLAAGGGVAGRVVRAHEKIFEPPTRLDGLGLVTGAEDRPINLADFALPFCAGAPRVPLLLVVGATMNSGKTRAAASLVRGLSRAGHAVGALKLTGTGASGDFFALRDAGACRVLDFTDAGLASTYRVPATELEATARVLQSQAAASGATVVVAELGDGLYQPETATLLESATLRSASTRVLFAGSNALACGAGVQWLQERGHRPAALSGRLCLSPLATEEARRTLGLPVLSLEELEDPGVAGSLLPSVVAAGAAW